MIELPWGSIQAAKIAEMDKIEMRKGYTMSCALNLGIRVSEEMVLFFKQGFRTPRSMLISLHYGLLWIYCRFLSGP